MATVPAQDQVAGFLSEQSSFALSLAVGAIVIALYARKRIEEFTRPPKGEEFDFTKMLTMGDIVGRSIFNRSFVLYLIFLEFLYLFMCTAKPVVLLIANDPTGAQAPFQGMAWPFGAALIVVGILPSVPMVAQIEAMLRGLAQRVASIPGEFYARVQRLSRNDIETLVADAPDYRRDMRKFWRIRNLLLGLGFNEDQATLMGRNCIALRLFATLTIRGERIWSKEEYEKYREIIQVLRPKSDMLENEIETLVATTLKSPQVREILAKSNIEDPAQDLSRETGEKLNRDAEALVRALNDSVDEKDLKAARNYEELVKRWSLLASECETGAKRLSALFAILARNDRETALTIKRGAAPGMLPAAKKPDAVLATLFRLVNDSVPTYPWSNAALLAIGIGFVGCVVPLCLYLYVTEILTQAAKPEIDWGQAIARTDATTIIKSGLITALTVGAMFALTSLIALFLRSLRIEEENWERFTSIWNFPFANYLAIVSWGSLAAFMPLLVSFIIYYYIGPGVKDLDKMTPEIIASDMFFRYILGFVAVAYGVSTCIIADFIDEGRTESARYIVYPLIFILAVEVLCLLVNPSYAEQPRAFWHNFVAVACYSLVALKVFQRSFSEIVARSGSREPREAASRDASLVYGGPMI